MSRAKTGRLKNRDKRAAYRDVRDVKKETNTLKKEIKRDMFNSGNMTIQQMNTNLRHIKKEVGRLSSVQQKVRDSHETYHDLENKKTELKVMKEHINKAKKLKKAGAKSDDLAKALKEGNFKRATPLNKLGNKLQHHHHHNPAPA